MDQREPDERIEAAAEGLYDAMPGLGDWGDAHDAIKSIYRRQATVCLAAADAVESVRRGRDQAARGELVDAPPGLFADAHRPQADDGANEEVLIDAVMGALFPLNSEGRWSGAPFTGYRARLVARVAVEALQPWLALPGLDTAAVAEKGLREKARWIRWTQPDMAPAQVVSLSDALAAVAEVERRAGAASAKLKLAIDETTHGKTASAEFIDKCVAEAYTLLVAEWRSGQEK